MKANCFHGLQCLKINESIMDRLIQPLVQDFCVSIAIVTSIGVTVLRKFKQRLPPQCSTGTHCLITRGHFLLSDEFWLKRYLYELVTS